MEKINAFRMLLSKLRKGDYLHAGDQEAAHLVLEKVLQLSPEIIDGYVLDVGSGFGGTADEFYKAGFHKILGIDIDKSAVSYAKERYPHIDFRAADAADISNLFPSEMFSFIYLFNVLYAIEDKLSTLKYLNVVAKPGAILAVFDYSAEQTDFPLLDLAGKQMFPIVLSSFQDQLIKSGWEILEVIDLSDQFILWYQNLLEKLEKDRFELSLEFSCKDIDRVESTFSVMLQWLKDKSLGGVLIFAKKTLSRIEV